MDTLNACANIVISRKCQQYRLFKSITCSKQALTMPALMVGNLLSFGGVFVWSHMEGPIECTTIRNEEHTFGGSKSLNPVRRPPRCPSMHNSQIKLVHPSDGGPDRDTHYADTFFQKPIIPANRLHLTSLVNRIGQQEGSDMKESIRVDPNTPTYFTQYNRIHNKLGTMLGTGVPREYPVRQEYNVITGETGGPAWRQDNRRISGDKYLHTLRKENTTIIG